MTRRGNASGPEPSAGEHRPVPVRLDALAPAAPDLQLQLVGIAEPSAVERELEAAQTRRSEALDPGGRPLGRRQIGHPSAAAPRPVCPDEQAAPALGDKFPDARTHDDLHEVRSRSGGGTSSPTKTMPFQ